MSVIVDTSGSMGSDELRLAFSEIEAISHKTKVNVLQWDVGFAAYNKYRRGDWKKIKCKGRGGTGNFSQAVKWLTDKRAMGNACVFITDGYMTDSDFPQEEVVPMLFIITSNQPGPKWAKDSQVIHVGGKQ